MPHAILVCSGARRPSPRLLSHPLIEQLSVITERGYQASYPPRVRVETVDTIHDVDQVRGAAWRILGDGPVDGVLAPYEVGLPAAGYLRSYFGLPGPGYDTVSAFTDKYVMKQRLAAAGLPLMPFRAAYSRAQVHRRAAESGWPAVVKPAHGGGCKGVAVVTGPDQLQEWLDDGGAPDDTTPTVVVERLADVAAEYHCDGVVHDGEVRSVITSRYLEPVLGRVGQGDPYGSYQLPESHPDHRMAAALHERAVAALGLRSGVTHLEVFGTADGPKVSEIACRPGGGGIPTAIQLRHGVDLLDACVRTSFELPVPSPHEAAAEPAAGEAQYFGHCGLGLREGRITAMTDERTLGRLPGVARVEMLRQVGDVISGHLYSASAAGFVYLRADTEEEVRARLTAVRTAYTIQAAAAPDTVPEQGAASAPAPDDRKAGSR